MDNSNLSNRFKTVGQERTGSHNVESGNAFNTIFTTICVQDGVYNLKTCIKMTLRNCDVAVGIAVNDVIATQRQFRAPSSYAVIETLESLVIASKGDIITIKAAQNSGNTVSASYSYNYQQF